MTVPKNHWACSEKITIDILLEVKEMAKAYVTGRDKWQGRGESNGNGILNTKNLPAPRTELHTNVEIIDLSVDHDIWTC
jgi:hypothetical protein